MKRMPPFYVLSRSLSARLALLTLILAVVGLSLAQASMAAASPQNGGAHSSGGSSSGNGHHGDDDDDDLSLIHI